MCVCRPVQSTALKQPRKRRLFELERTQSLSVHYRVNQAAQRIVVAAQYPRHVAQIHCKVELVHDHEAALRHKLHHALGQQRPGNAAESTRSDSMRSTSTLSPSHV